MGHPIAENRKRFRNLINYKGEEIKRGFDYISQFSNGQAKARCNNEWGIIDTKGNEVCEIIQFSNGLKMYHSSYSKKYCMLSDSHNDESKTTYDAVVDLNNGQIKVLKNGNWGILDNKGKEIFDIIPIGHGYFKYFSKLYEAYGLMANNKKPITEPIYSVIKDIYSDIFVCEINNTNSWRHLNDNKWGGINTEGKTIIPFIYDIFEDFIDNRAKVRKGGIWGEIDINGNEIPELTILNNGFYVYRSLFNGTCGLMDANKKILTKQVFSIIEDFYNGKAWAQKSMKWVIINEKGETFSIPIDYHSLEPLSNGRAIVCKNMKFGLIDIDGKELIPLEYDHLFKYANKTYSILKDKKWGIINDDGNIILPVEYDRIGDLKDEKAIIEKGEKVEIICFEGENDVTEIKHQEALMYTALSNGMIKYNYLNRNKYGLMSSDKTKVTDVVFDEIRDYSDGYAIAKRHGQYGHINEKGKEIYDRIVLSNGFIKEISTFNNNCRLIDSTNRVIVGFSYRDIDDFTEGYAKVFTGYNWGVINESGKITVPCEYSQLGEIQEGKIKAKKNGSWGIIDTDNKIIVPFKYDELGEYQKGKIKARLSSKWGFVDGDGGRGISFNYDKVSDFSGGKAICVIDDIYGVIDQRGRTLIPFEYYDIKVFVDGIAIAQDCDFKWGTIDENDRITIPFEFDEICSFKEGKARARKGELWGFINARGETLIPFEYYKLEDFVDGKAKALKCNFDNNYAYENLGYINEKGEEILEYRSLSNGMTLEIYPLQGKQRFMNSNGEYISNQNYTDIEDFVDGKLICAKGYHKWGVIDENFQEYIPFIFYKITYLGQNRFEVTEEIRQRWGGRKYIKKILSKGIEKDENDTHGQMKMQNTIYNGVVDGKAPFGLFVRVPNVGRGLIRKNLIIKRGKRINDFKRGDKIKVKILKMNKENGRIYYDFS